MTEKQNTNFKFIKPEVKELVSIVIPAYNRQDYIKETVDSVLNQTYKNFELIVVDDGSNDGTLEILQDYGEQLTLLQHPNAENRGQAAAINMGLKQASGEYVAILDSDDYWSLDYLEKMVDCLKSESGVGLVYSNGYAVDKKGEHLYQLIKNEHVEQNQPGDILLDCYVCLPGGSLVRRSVYEIVGGFDESLRAGQDHDMCIRIAENTQFGFNNKKLFHYRKHQDTISKKGLSIRWTNGFIILDKAMRRVDYPKSVINKRKAVLNYRMGKNLISNSSFFRAVYCFFLSARYDPVRSLKVILRIEVKN